jgi:chemotaxis protein CheX
VLLNGVRNAAIATARKSGEVEMERAMAVTLRESLQLVSDPKNLDATVEEVFKMMLGSTASAIRRTSRHGARVGDCRGGLWRPLERRLLVQERQLDGHQDRRAMTGMEFAEVDDTVKDGIGEIGNMLAGAWKGKVPDLAANCGLSIPAVITGRDYNLHVQAPEFKLVHFYRLRRRQL